MLETLLTAGLLGFITGIVPGPYTTVVAGTALERGFRAGAWLALIPLVTDVPAMLVTALVLQRVSDRVFTVIGIAGGLLIVLLGARLVQRQGAAWRARRAGDAARPARELRTTFWAMATGGILSPAPWIFWLVAASPLLLRAWNRSWVHGVVFAVTLFAMLIATAVGIAWLAARGRHVMSEHWRRRLLRTVGVTLGVIGAVVVWQSATGDFQRLVRQQEALRERVD